jgi:uncharacterized FlgJ-related protein
MRLGIFLLLLLGGAASARAQGAEPSAEPTPAEIFCTQMAQSSDANLAQINTLVEVLEKVNGCVVPAESPPPDFRRFAQGNARKKAFLHYWGPHAVMIQEKSGFPASVLLAQWAEESFWGSSNLYVNAHNLSGHFCPARKAGEIYEYEVKFGDYSRVMVAQCGGDTAQKGSRALVFSNPVDSAWAHAYNLTQAPSRAATYKQIRAEVAKASPGQPADWRKIIPELNRHYAPGQSYGRKIADHITSKSLDAWEKAKLCD